MQVTVGHAVNTVRDNAAVQAVKDAVSVLNTAIQAAAERNIEVEIEKLEHHAIGAPGRALMLTATCKKILE